MSYFCDKNGFDWEQHWVTTSDGYILELWRIPGLKGENKTKKEAVLLQHCLDCDMMVWVVNDPDLAPAFTLVRAGFDVWLGNNRGTKYGLNHTTMDPKSARFWDFDQETMGLHDVPAEIEHIKKVTGQSKISYVGHSEGTTQMFMAASLMPEYFENNLHIFIALAPVVKMNNVRSEALQYLSQHIAAVEFLLIDVLHLYNLVHPTMVLNWSFVTFCHFFDPVCKYALYMVSDSEVSLDNMSRDDVYYSLFPSGCGWRNFLHYAQLIHDGGFRRYDWGAKKNMEIYGVETAPDYNLKAFKDLPVALLYGDTDELADSEDV